MLDINKQKMAYSLQNVRVPIYDTDEDGNIKYITVDGVKVPVDTGEYTTGYSKPVFFMPVLTISWTMFLLRNSVLINLQTTHRL